MVLNPDVNITAEQVLKLEKIARKIKNFGILTCECNGLHETVNSNLDRYEKIKLNNVDFYKKKLLVITPKFHSYLVGVCFLNQKI